MTKTVISNNSQFFHLTRVLNKIPKRRGSTIESMMPYDANKRMTLIISRNHL